MQIVFDKLKENGSYPVSHKDIKVLFRIIPDHWISGIKIVHFLGQAPHSSRFARPVRKEMLSGILNLSILGLTKEEVIKEILTELIQDSRDEPHLKSKSFRELEKSQIRRINEIMSPYLDKFKEQREENENIT
ncbi:MAG: hypothetical protein RIB71_23060 [Imperialibacter sp.]|uniref:hypothetical protein n=1 Tax=Imperialibacter sp. TaxID=2038411 RepID=UPI0032F00FA8